MLLKYKIPFSSISNHFEDKPKVLRNIFRVIKQGGKLVIAHGSSRQAVNTLHREVGGTVRQERIPDKKTMVTLLTTASFVNIEIHDKEEYYLACAMKLQK